MSTPMLPPITFTTPEAPHTPQYPYSGGAHIGPATTQQVSFSVRTIDPALVGSCSRCKALVMRDHWDEHREWHEAPSLYLIGSVETLQGRDG